jgi:hypothetical protein
MMDGGEQMTQDGSEFRGARVKTFETDPGNPHEGRIFVWTKTGSLLNFIVSRITTRRQIWLPALGVYPLCPCYV